MTQVYARSDRQKKSLTDSYGEMGVGVGCVCVCVCVGERNESQIMMRNLLVLSATGQLTGCNNNNDLKGKK